MLARPRILGILNVTPDSFSDGGLWADQESAIARGVELQQLGADLVDVGGESTRPGAARPELSAELERVIPVIEALSAEGVGCSIDTMRAEVAEAALSAGAVMINDVSGGLADPRILIVAAHHQVPYIAMHWRAHSESMGEWAVYPDGVTNAVRRELAQRRDAALEAGILAENLILDPGLGFAKTAEHNWSLLRGLDGLSGLGHPLLIGASRKSFLGALLAELEPEGRHGGGTPRPRNVDERESAHLGLLSWLAQRGVWGVRVHDVRASADAFAALTELGVIQ